jgi:hypothetical protein
MSLPSARLRGGNGVTRHLTLCTMLTLSVPRIASACPVCFGATDGPMVRGSNRGILALLLVTLAVLGAFGRFFRNLARCAQHAVDATGTSAPPAAPMSAEGSIR